MSKIKIILISVIVILSLIIILQNMKAVETKILFFTIIMPRIVFLLFMMGVGFILGIIYMKKKGQITE
ncbi:hypothetical protein JW835_13465 [bacterium]|nr:hypothetical protein [bacterium]